MDTATTAIASDESHVYQSNAVKRRNGIDKTFENLEEKDEERDILFSAVLFLHTVIISSRAYRTMKDILIDGFTHCVDLHPV
jgi:hypothetical protein